MAEKKVDAMVAQMVDVTVESRAVHLVVAMAACLAGLKVGL